MRDLNSAASVTLGVVFVEAQAINYTGEILVMGGLRTIQREWRSCSGMRAGPSVELPADTVLQNDGGGARTVVSKLSQKPSCKRGSQALVGSLDCIGAWKNPSPQLSPSSRGEAEPVTAAFGGNTLLKRSSCGTCAI